MTELRDIDPSSPFLAQLHGPDDGQPVVLIEPYVVPDGQTEEFLATWHQVTLFMKAQPGYVTGQLYRGTSGSHVLAHTAVWENLGALQQAVTSEEFRKIVRRSPDGTVALPVIVRQAAVPGICVGS
ncbi:antibiotic biosynthesis monooxygenase family protein [Streptomyces sp. NBC_00063]|uniref:antibiotic biosynthesis monooxygenase family protein n=1 Tax=Streptomyces sp. NBC_00063 TaxID=2975638 RepID=UPI003D71DFB4